MPIPNTATTNRIAVAAAQIRSDGPRSRRTYRLLSVGGSKISRKIFCERRALLRDKLQSVAPDPARSAGDHRSVLGSVRDLRSDSADPPTLPRHLDGPRVIPATDPVDSCDRLNSVQDRQDGEGDTSSADPATAPDLDPLVARSLECFAERRDRVLGIGGAHEVAAVDPRVRPIGSGWRVGQEIDAELRQHVRRPRVSQGPSPHPTPARQDNHSLVVGPRSHRRIVPRRRRPDRRHRQGTPALRHRPRSLCRLISPRRWSVLLELATRSLCSGVILPRASVRPSSEGLTAPGCRCRTLRCWARSPRSVRQSPSAG